MKKSIIQEVFKFSNSSQSLAKKNFILSNSNHKAFLYVSNWPNWQTNTTIIYGTKGTGKTYLSKIWQKMSKAADLNLFQLSQEKLESILDRFDAFILDDFEKYFIQKHKLRNLDTHDFVDFNRTLTEIINYCALNQKHLLLIANTNPENIIFKLEDLHSRIESTPSFRLGSPDEAMIQTFLVKRFSDLQLKVSIDVIKHASSRLERSLTTANEFAVQLDKLSLTSKKSPSVHMSRILLSEMNSEVN